MEGTAAFAYAPQRIRDVVPPALQEGLDKTHHRWLDVRPHNGVGLSLFSTRQQQPILHRTRTHTLPFIQLFSSFFLRTPSLLICPAAYLRTYSVKEITSCIHI